MSGLADLFPKIMPDPRTRFPSVGRNVQFTPHRREVILAYVLEGMNPRSSSILAGITPRTFDLWMQEGRTEIQDFEDDIVPILGDKGQFVMNVGRAQIKWAYNERKDIRKLLMKDAKYSAVYVKLLEAEYPDYLKPAKQVEIKGEVEIKYNVQVLGGEAWTQRQISQGVAEATAEATTEEDEESIEAQFADYETEGE
jgi:hypothetical protein